MATLGFALGAGTALSGMASPGSSRSWYDLIAVEEELMLARVLRMSASEWKVECARLIREWSGKEVKPCLAYIERMDRERAAYATRKAQPVPMPRQKTEFDIDFALWKEMVEEPAKFGDDITDWLALDEKLRNGPGRWRIAAYWTERQMEVDEAEEALVAPWRKLYSQLAKEAALAGEQDWIRRDIKRIVGRIRNSAVRIQAAVRGHLVRNGAPFRDCCMCLSHRICPVQTDLGMMCRDCAAHGVDVSFSWN
jgi:hypothetical protein